MLNNNNYYYWGGAGDVGVFPCVVAETRECGFEEGNGFVRSYPTWSIAFGDRITLAESKYKGRILINFLLLLRLDEDLSEKVARSRTSQAS